MGNLSTLGLRIAAIFIGGALIASGSRPARADSCETAPGSQVYTDQNCTKQDNTYDLGKRGQKAKSAVKSDDLRDRLKRAMARKAEHDKAAQSAMRACEAGDEKTFRLNMERARRTGDDDQNTKSAYDQFAQSCEAKFADAPAEKQTVSAPIVADKPSDPLEGWPAECREAAARLAAGGRKKDGVAASSAYAALHEDQTCSAYLSSLAGRAGARLPERKMTNRSRRALQAAMSGEADALAGAVSDRAYDASYDPSEVLDFGLAIFGTLAGARVGGLHSAPASRIVPRAQVSAPTPSFRPQPPSRQSDITGTR